VRRDLPAAQVVVQSVHAAVEAARRFLPADYPHPHLVVCRVAAERDLLAAADRLDRLGIRFELFREPDRAGEATALATEPLGSERRHALARYPCLTRSDLLAAPEPLPAPDDAVPRPAPTGSCPEDVP
jgi:hypothetical protein